MIRLWRLLVGLSGRNPLPFSADCRTLVVKGEFPQVDGGDRPEAAAGSLHTYNAHTVHRVCGAQFVVYRFAGFSVPPNSFP